VFIVDLHTLQTVNFLNTVYDIFLYSSWSFDRQDIARRDLSIRQRHTCFDKVIVLYKDVLRKRYQVFLHLSVTGLDRNLTVTTLHTAQRHDAIKLRHHSWVGRITCLKQFGHTWKTSCDISCLTGRTWDLDQYSSFFHFLPIGNRYVRSYRNVVRTNDLA